MAAPRQLERSRNCASTDRLQKAANGCAHSMRWLGARRGRASGDSVNSMANGRFFGWIWWLLDGARGSSGRLVARWIFLRALGVIYFSAFYSLARQILGLIGPAGILPASEYLQAVARSAGHARFWYAPTLLWFSGGSPALMALC